MWNDLGYEGLLPSPNKGGRSPRLTDEDLEDLRGILEFKDYWTRKEVVVLIKEVFMKKLSEDQVRRILRDKLGMRDYQSHINVSIEDRITPKGS